MSDLINREDAIEALTAEFCITGKENARTILNYLDLVKTRIKAIPSADRPQGWIPCSEMSPEENGEYLITLAFAWGREIEVGLWSDGEWLNDNSHVNIAWMPLPKPWKGADDDQNIQSADE